MSSDRQTMQETDREALSMPASDLVLIERLARLGIDGVEHRLQWLSNYNDSIGSETIKTGYVDSHALDDQFRTAELLGVRVRVTSAPCGYALVLFPVESANAAAALMLSSTVDSLDAVSVEMARSSLTELGGIMTNGFFDAWANRFDQEIDLAEPTPVHNTEREIIRRSVGGIDAFGIYLASRIQLPNHGVSAQVYLFPDNSTFVELIDRLDPEMIE